MSIIQVELHIWLLAVNQDASEVTEQFTIQTFEAYGTSMDGAKANWKECAYFVDAWIYANEMHTW